MSNSTRRHAMGDVEVAFYRMAVHSLGGLVELMAPAIGHGAAMGLVSMALGHLHAAQYPGVDGCGEGVHLHNFRSGVATGREGGMGPAQGSA